MTIMLTHLTFFTFLTNFLSFDIPIPNYFTLLTHFFLLSQLNNSYDYCLLKIYIDVPPKTWKINYICCVKEKRNILRVNI